jgi:hypothetical protein
MSTWYEVKKVDDQGREEIVYSGESASEARSDWRLAWKQSPKGHTVTLEYWEDQADDAVLVARWNTDKNKWVWTREADDQTPEPDLDPGNPPKYDIRTIPEDFTPAIFVTKTKSGADSKAVKWMLKQLDKQIWRYGEDTTRNPKPQYGGDLFYELMLAKDYDTKYEQAAIEISTSDKDAAIRRFDQVVTKRDEGILFAFERDLRGGQPYVIAVWAPKERLWVYQ